MIAEAEKRVASIIDSNTAMINASDEAVIKARAALAEVSAELAQRQEELAEVNSRIDRAKAFLSDLAGSASPKTE